jgi:phosphate transport system substrate-binding protein
MTPHGFRGLTERASMHVSSNARVIVRTLFVMAATWCSAFAALAADVHGSGSTFVYPVMLRWAAGYNAQTGAKINYQPIGSGGGISQVKAGSVVFAASDKPLAPDELAAAGLMQFPLVIGGVVPVVNLEGVKPGELKLTGEVMAEIFLGNVTLWSDPAIAALNPDLKLPALKISVVHRSDSSGTTFNLVNYLSAVSADWKSVVGEGTTVNWPIGAAGNGNEGVARHVNYTKGAIGYVELTYAIQSKMTFTSLRNADGKFVQPSASSFQAAADSADWSSPDFYQLLTGRPGADSWPITATVFALMPHAGKNRDQSSEALRFFRWSLEDGRKDTKMLNYVPLPDKLVERVKAYWAENAK